MNDTQTAEGWYQSYLEAHKRALKAEERCNELEAERDALKENYDASIATRKHMVGLLQKQRDTLRANNAALREALEYEQAQTCRTYCNKPDTQAHIERCQYLTELLASTPADSLTEYRNGVLEEMCSQVEKEWPSSKVLVTIRAMRTTND